MAESVPTIDYAHPASDGRVTIRSMPDGSVEIDVPPPGVRRAIGLRPAQSAAAVFAFAGVCVVGPAAVPAYQYVHTRDVIYLMETVGAVVIGCVVAAVIAVAARAAGTTRTTLRCEDDGLTLEQTARVLDTVRRRWPRPRIAAVDVGHVRTEDGKRATLRVHLVGPVAVDDLLTGRLTAAELEPVAAAIRGRLRL